MRRADFCSPWPLYLLALVLMHPRLRSLAAVTTSPRAISSGNHNGIEYELDDDALDGDSLEALRTPHRQRGAGHAHSRMTSRGGEQHMPLLVGLVDASAYRSPDTPRGASMDIDLELLAAKRAERGGGMLDSIANMANSILGAGARGLNGIM